MSLMSSFENGVAAMMAQSTAMDAISQNIANVRTTGYKRADTTFAALLSGIDVSPFKPGGVTAQTRKLVDIQGAVEGSTRPLDLAISGRGMFVYSTETTGAGDLFYSRKGSLGAVGVPADVSGSGYLSAFEDLFLMAWPVDATGTATGTTSGDMVAIPASLNGPFPGRATTTASLSMILPATGSTSESVDIYHFDALGALQTTRLTWTNTGINAWDVEGFDGTGTSLGAPTAVTFDGDGNIVAPTSLTVAGFTIDLSNVTQRGAVLFKGLYTQDGLATGDFLEYQISDTGLVSAQFNSGAVTPLYQLPLALFSNTNGLAEFPGDLWGLSETSGDPEFVLAGITGRIMSGANELSNVDLADAFSQLIITQRAYSSAAQLIQTADEMTQTARDLR